MQAFFSDPHILVAIVGFISAVSALVVAITAHISASTANKNVVSNSRAIEGEMDARIYAAFKAGLEAASVSTNSGQPAHISAAEGAKAAVKASEDLRSILPATKAAEERAKNGT